jgi:hypothetical protein
VGPVKRPAGALPRLLASERELTVNATGNLRQRHAVERRKLTLFKRQFSVDPEYGNSPPQAHSAFAPICV